MDKSDGWNTPNLDEDAEVSINKTTILEDDKSLNDSEVTDEKELESQLGMQPEKNATSHCSEFSKNISSSHVLDDADSEENLKEETTSEKICEPCREMQQKVTAVSFCSDCQEYLCETCKNRHMTQKISKTHVLNDPKEFKETLKKETISEKKCEPCLGMQQDVTAISFCCNCKEYLCDACKRRHLIQKISKSHVLKDVGGCDENIQEDVIFEKKCEPCLGMNHEVFATSFCCDCKEYLCEKCKTHHLSQKISKTHILKAAEEFKENFIVKLEICEPCKTQGIEEIATSYCEDCEEYQCDNCKNQHKAQKMTRYHKIVIAEEHTNRASETFSCEPCAYFQIDKDASKYCEECSEFLCTDCHVKHLSSKMTSRHTFSTVEEHLGKLKDCDDIFCGPCLANNVKRKAVSYCVDCIDPEPFCQSCSDFHKAQKSSRSHTLSPKLEAMSNNLSDESNAKCKSSKEEVQARSETNKCSNQSVNHAEQSDMAPSKPEAKSVKSDGITLVWRAPAAFKTSDYYQIRYKTVTNGKWRFHDEQPSKATVVISSLRADTSFVFQVRIVQDDIEGPYSPISEIVQTKKSPANILFDYSEKIRDGPPDLYQLPKTENVRARNKHAKTRKFDLGSPPKSGTEKTIMLVGATGTGKSTLVDGIVNYVLGVNWDDSFRYTLVDLEKEEQSKLHNQAVSQTEWVTCYSINMEEGSRLDYRLNIIDTPGFGDTRGLERDQLIVEQIRELFSANGEQGVVFIDAVCFLIKAPDARLTATQKYIFHAIMSLFGNDIADNICTLVTFADGDNPPVLAALEEANLPFGNWFPFNNSGLFAKNTDSSRSSLSPMFWEMGLRSFHGFFKQLLKMETRSLQLTKQVLSQRQRLELTIQNLQPQVDAGLSKLNEMTQELQIIEQHKTDIEANRDFTYQVTETKHVKHDLPQGQHVTNCLNCHVTCHNNCAIPRDEDKSGCCAMDSSGNCTQCSEKCHWKQHANTPYIFEYIQEQCTKTYAEKQAKYQEAEGEKMTHEKVVQRMEKELHDLEYDIQNMMLDVKECNEILREIALRPNPLSMVEHIDMMIEAEKMEKKTGFMERIKVLQGYRKRAEIGKDVDRFQKGFKSTRQSRGVSTVTVTAVPEPSVMKKAYKTFKNIFR